MSVYHEIENSLPLIASKNFFDPSLTPDDYDQHSNQLALPFDILNPFPGFFYTRHGQTDSNIKNHCAGGDSNGQLTSQGKAQASSLSPVIGRMSPYISAIFCSSKGRAIHTANLMNSNAQLEVRATRQIVEKYYGGWDSRHHNQPAYKAPHKTIGDAIMGFETPKGAETALEAAKRFSKGLKNIFEKSAGYGTDKAPFLVAHAGIIQYYTAFSNVRWPAGDDKAYGNIKNSTIYFFEFCDDLIAFGKESHPLPWRCWALAQPERSDHDDLIVGRNVNGNDPVWVQVDWEALNPKIGMHHTSPKVNQNTPLPPYLAKMGFELA